jgi:DNA-binding NtrC family response regulator
LYSRLSAFKLNIPSLRERREEIPLLLGHFMNRLTRRYGVPAPHVSSALLEASQRYSWPGNLPELEVFVKRFLVSGEEMAALEELNIHRELETGNGVGNGHANDNGYTKNGNLPTEAKSSLKSLVRHAKGEAERSAIARALEETHWNRKAAARQLSMSYRALLYKIQEYQLIPQESFSLRGQASRTGD